MLPMYVTSLKPQIKRVCVIWFTSKRRPHDMLTDINGGLMGRRCIIKCVLLKWKLAFVVHIQ